MVVYSYLVDMGMKQVIGYRKTRRMVWHGDEQHLWTAGTEIASRIQFSLRAQWSTEHCRAAGYWIQGVPIQVLVWFAALSSPEANTFKISYTMGKRRKSIPLKNIIWLSTPSSRPCLGRLLAIPPFTLICPVSSCHVNLQRGKKRSKRQHKKRPQMCLIKLVILADSACLARQIYVLHETFQSNARGIFNICNVDHYC